MQSTQVLLGIIYYQTQQKGNSATKINLYLCNFIFGYKGVAVLSFVTMFQCTNFLKLITPKNMHSNIIILL